MADITDMNVTNSKSGDATVELAVENEQQLSDVVTTYRPVIATTHNKSNIQKNLEALISMDITDLSILSAQSYLRFIFKLKKEYKIISIDKIKITHKDIDDYNKYLSNVYSYFKEYNEWPKAIENKRVLVEESNLLKIEIIWRLHMMQPRRYRRNCLQYFGVIVPFILDEHPFLYNIQCKQYIDSNENDSKNNDNKAKSKVTGVFKCELDTLKFQQIWMKEMYNIQKILYIFKKYFNVNYQMMNDICSKNNNNDNYNSNKKLETDTLLLNECLQLCLLRYCQFINLKKETIIEKNNQGTFVLVAPLDIKLILHSQMCIPLWYNYILSYQLLNMTNDVYDDNSKMSLSPILGQNRQYTQSKWQEFYETESSYGIFDYTSDAWNVVLCNFEKSNTGKRRLNEQERILGHIDDGAMLDDINNKCNIYSICCYGCDCNYLYEKLTYDWKAHVIVALLAILFFLLMFLSIFGYSSFENKNNDLAVYSIIIPVFFMLCILVCIRKVIKRATFLECWGICDLCDPCDCDSSGGSGGTGDNFAGAQMQALAAST